MVVISLRVRTGNYLAEHTARTCLP